MFTDKMIANETLKDVPLLLLANKQDLKVNRTEVLYNTP